MKFQAPFCTLKLFKLRYLTLTNLYTLKIIPFSQFHSQFLEPYFPHFFSKKKTQWHVIYEMQSCIEIENCGHGQFSQTPKICVFADLTFSLDIKIGETFVLLSFLKTTEFHHFLLRGGTGLIVAVTPIRMWNTLKKN